MKGGLEDLESLEGAGIYASTRAGVNARFSTETSEIRRTLGGARESEKSYASASEGRHNRRAAGE
jgi:hypothetical protein